MKIKMVVFLGVFYCLFSASSQAQIFVQTGVDVGRIVSLNTDHSITLDNRTIYTPARQDIILNDLHPGDIVSIDYTLEASNSKVYFEVKRATASSMSKALTKPQVNERKGLK